ncbi:MAG: ribosome-associated translation inhibitor RaiA [Candidatus Eremiobacteraeota bacterium]|nr:ribosome-associated translation inhibitor RaiA [Candidatus Eremiobacteraeota bacterium]
MKIFVKGRNLRVTPALKAYVEEKIGHLEHYLDPILDAHVTLRTERTLQIVDVVLNLKHYLMKAEERTPDMYASIDLVRDRLEQQIRKYKTRHWSHHTRNGKTPGSPNRPAKGRTRSPAAETVDGESDKQLQIVRSKRIALTPLSAQDAMRQMELLGHDFFVFINDETGAVNVLYKRRSGQLGLIEPIT